MTRVILDTGPLVAFLDRRGRHHEWASAQWGLIRPPFLTCESVLAEACFLLAGKPGGLPLLFELLCRGMISLPFRLEDHAEAVAKLIEKYSNIPMSLADACLARMSELFPSGQVFTCDGDFRLYRKHGRQVIPLIAPDGL